MRHAVEPVADAVVPGDAVGLAGQHEESRLESVLGIGGIAQYAPAHAQTSEPCR